MDSFSMNIKVEKANAIKKHRQLQKIASFFRFIEVCIVLALVSRFSIQLPVAVKNSCVYFKDLSVILVSPRFVFIIGNIIVITLLAKSRHFTVKKTSGTNPTNDVYEEFLKKSKRVQEINRYESKNREKQSNSVWNKPENREKLGSSVQQKVILEETCTSLAIKHFERIQSEKVEQCEPGDLYKELRRTVTGKCKGSVECREGWVKITYPEDRMSNEEFKCTIESFIERQKRFRRDEENYYCILN